MKKVLIIMAAILLLFSCDHNVYIDDAIDNPAERIWRVEESYFETASEAISYIMSNRAMKTDDSSRTITLMRPVLASDSDGIINEGYKAYVEADGLRGSIIVPEGFSGDLCIDFNGYRYDFSNTCTSFFEIKGGDNVYIYNGTSVIFNEASHKPYAIAVNTDTVSIDAHLLDDRREDNSLIYVGERGHLRINGVEGTLSGAIALVTDNRSGGVLDIEDSDITLRDIYTMYKNSDGSVSEAIADSVSIAEDAKSRINIYSGTVRIDSFNKKSDYYSSEGGAVFDKAYLNVLGTSGSTVIYTRHEVYEAVEKAIESSSGDAKQIIAHDMTHHPRAEATCIAAGNIEYWTCDGSEDCRGRYYTKEDGSAYSTDYSDVVILLDPEAHSLIHMEAKAATCTEDGNIEYWYCTLCKKYFEDEAATREIAEKDTVNPHHSVSDEWEYDVDDHWHVCERDGYRVDVTAHSWGEWQEYKSGGTVTHHYAECEVCGARKIASKPDYLVYNIGIGEVKLENIEDRPCGDFLINGIKVAVDETVCVSGSEVKAEFKPYLGSNTSYKATTQIVNNGLKEITGFKDSYGSYSVSFTLENTTEYIVNIQLSTGGGNLGFSCNIRMRNK